ncbi:MAG: HPr(Ser) kinase/phosphatase [Lentisphaerae bacterium]|nr:HPr(Ser) kinase/phosphatase [Lentisphaerota bacterium]
MSQTPKESEAATSCPASRGGMQHGAEVTVGSFYEAGRERLGLTLVAGSAGLPRVVQEPSLYRCGLALTGFHENFAYQRVQVIGSSEHAYLDSLPMEKRVDSVERLFRAGIPCLVFSNGRKSFAEADRMGDYLGVPVLRTPLSSIRFMAEATMMLELLSAPRCRVHGTMLEVAGLGVMIEGPAGVGKSETALGLIKRGHALVADDLTALRRDPAGTLHGSAVEVTRHYMEIRGIGIIYVPRLFGVAAARGEKTLDLVITLRPQSVNDADLDRTGAQNLTREFLGVSVPQLVIPVAPGRDLVNIVETAAMEHKLRATGVIAYSDLAERIKRHHTRS